MPSSLRSTIIQPDTRVDHDNLTSYSLASLLSEEIVQGCKARLKARAQWVPIEPLQQKLNFLDLQHWDRLASEVQTFRDQSWHDHLG